MKKLFYFIALAAFSLMGFVWADVDSVYVSPTSQTAISGALLSFTITGHNGTGVAYLKYILPQTASYDIMYHNGTPTPINNSLLSLGIEHDPVFSLAANSNFSVTITARVHAMTWALPTMTPQALFGDTQQVTNVLTSALATITPVSDLKITNILTGEYPSISGDNVSYLITLQNIGSTSATDVSFISTFPIPTLGSPIALFDGVAYGYTSITYPADFVWNGSYLGTLVPGQLITILLSAPLMQNFSVGTPFNQTAKTSTVSPEFTTGNNSVTAAGNVVAPANVRVTKTLTPFTGFHAGDQVIYTITYGNNGGKTAQNVVITDTMNGNISLPTTNFTIGSLPAGSGGTMILTGTFNDTFASGYTFINTATISTTSSESITGNNISIVTGSIQGRENISLHIIANNLTRPQLDNPPYGSGEDIMIQAISGDLIQFTLSYANLGNVAGTNAIIGLSGTQGLVSMGGYNGTLGTLATNTSGTLIITGIVGPRNYISFTPTARLAYNTTHLITDSVIVQEPMICGDGILTRNEPCDTQGNLGVLYSGQSCENQQGICVLVTDAIVNLACVNYQYTNPLGATLTGQVCSSVNTPLMDANCISLTGSAPVATNSGYNVNYTCRGSNTTATTPITLHCGDGTSISGIGAELNGTCRYQQGFNGTAQCSVGNDTNNPVCRLPTSPNAGLCESLDALDGTVLIVDEKGDAEGNFRCETVNGIDAQITIDCGNGDEYTSDEHTDIYEHTCTYDNVNVADQFDVECRVDGVSAPACQETIIVDEAILGYCGDGIVEGYEDCDDGNTNDNDACTNGCDNKNPGLVGCFNVGNTNISIEKGEMLPFRWTLDGSKNIIPGSSCEGQPEGKIPEESIYCTFNIYNGEHQEIDNDPLFTMTKKCNEDNRDTLPLFSYFLNQQNQRRSLKNAFGKYYIDTDQLDTDIFGEYKIVLDRVEYDYCRDDDKKDEGTAIDRVCTVNFTMTQPYLAQKSTFGITPKATNLKLDGYQTLDGADLISITDLEDIMVLDEAEYDGGSEVDEMMTTFINKYEKLAITVPKSNLGGTIFEGLDITVKVVPQQKIYILDAENERKVITLKNITSFTTPFTIITKNIDLVIKGNIDYNGMFLVKDGTITFDKSDASVGGDRCPAPQVIKGIFITDKGFEGRVPALKNDNLRLNRCTYGNLQVKGILIGDGVENIVNSRRSHLNQWFTKAGGDPTIKAARRNDIFNGAALLIEYSPSLWSSLPPGASEFTKVLDIYKQ